jgi:hypothetical protein
MARTSRTKTTELTPFDLVLPDELKIEPIFTISLPGNHQALVYKDSRKTEKLKPDGGGYHTVDEEGFRLVVKGPKWGEHNLGGWKGHFYSSLLDVKLAIEADCHTLTPKKRTTVEEQE